MAEKKEEKKESYTPPKGSITDQRDTIGGKKIEYKAHAEWLVLRKKEKPLAEMFHIAYIQKKQNVAKRPVTFVFNGGPGAASAYLHMGAIGPKRVMFNNDGTTPKPPVTLATNNESWLAFTDLVFIDPIGTGFSRMIDEDDLPKKADTGKDSAKKEPRDENEYFKLNRDLESLGEFISKFLSVHKRWESPVFVAGESYGGFRTACLAKRLQEGYGVGLNGVVIISPALEFIPLDPTDYDIQPWTDLFPTMAAGAAFHGKSKKFKKNTPIDKILKAAETFARTKLTKLLSSGDDLSTKEKKSIIREMSSFIGIPEDVLDDAEGRLKYYFFSKKLLKKEKKVLGHYDASMTGINPFPDRDCEFGPDPTLSGIERIFAAGINTQLRKNLKLDTDKDYHLLNFNVNMNWQDDRKMHFFMRQIGATDELRYGMALNPHMKVFVTHGYYDMVTPYHSSTRLVKQMRLQPEQKKNMTVKHFKGGHMFYTWEESRKAFKNEMVKFFKSAM